MSISAYQKLIRLIAGAAPALADLHGHTLRHTWNDKFSELMDTMDNPPSPEDQEARRSYLQGWKQGSGSAVTYNKRFTEAKGMEHGLNLQKGITRIPENLKK
jgi:integrase